VGYATTNQPLPGRVLHRVALWQLQANRTRQPNQRRQLVTIHAVTTLQCVQPQFANGQMQKHYAEKRAIQVAKFEQPENRTRDRPGRPSRQEQRSHRKYRIQLQANHPVKIMFNLNQCAARDISNVTN
jgi:hypothetical protein